MDQSVQFGVSKDGKLIHGLNEPLSFLKNWFSATGDGKIGDGSANVSIVSVEVPAGAVVMLWNLFATLHDANGLSGRINVVKSTTAAIGGTDVLLLTQNLKCPIAVGPLGKSASLHLKGEKAPLAIVDNKAGSASVYLNVEIPRYIAGSVDAADADKEYSAQINGVKYT